MLFAMVFRNSPLKFKQCTPWTSQYRLFGQKFVRNLRRIVTPVSCQLLMCCCIKAILSSRLVFFERFILWILGSRLVWADLFFFQWLRRRSTSGSNLHMWWSISDRKKSLVHACLLTSSLGSWRAAIELFCFILFMLLTVPLSLSFNLNAWDIWYHRS